jgi:hypothetical protein
MASVQVDMAAALALAVAQDVPPAAAAELIMAAAEGLRAGVAERKAGT